MRIFPKLLILLLAVALVPLVGLSLYQLQTMRKIEREAADHAGSMLVQEATRELGQLVDDYSRIEHQEELTLGVAIMLQAKEVERQLAMEPEGSLRVYFSEDFDSGVDLPPGMTVLPQYARQYQDGSFTGRPVSFDEPDFKPAPGTDRIATAKDIVRLENMKTLYKTMHRDLGDVMLLSLTGLENGVFSQYPGMGGYPEDYDHRTRPWYVEAKKSGAMIWTPPMIDAQGLGVISAVAMPVYRPDGSFAGVTAIKDCVFQELGLWQYNAPWTSDMKGWLVSLKPREETGGTGLEIIGTRNLHTQARDWKAELRTEWLEAPAGDEYESMVRLIRERKSGVKAMPFEGRDSLWAFAAPGGAEAALIVIVPIEAVTAQSRELQELIHSRTSRKLLIVSVAALAVFLAITWASLAGSRVMTSPLRALSHAAEEISRGNLDVSLPRIGSGDEIGDLARAVSRMKEDLKVYIAHLTEAAVSRERIESELKIARRIQMSFLPKAVSPFPEGAAFDLFASIEPAREIGGDLYDFFMIDDTHLFFSIGDVSGKGVPAALFMAVAKSLMKTVAREHNRPDEILRIVNAQLHKENENMMFVTLLCGVLNTATGELLIANAGHNPPVLVRKQKDVSFFTLEKALVLGISELAAYRTQVLHMEPGDALFMYTDGVTDAANENSELFSRSRLLDEISSLSASSPEEMIRGIMERVRSFAGNMPQADDIAMLMIRSKCPPN